MGQLSPKKVLDDARPTESTNLERQAVGTAGRLPGVGITPDAGAGVADPASPLPSRPGRAIAGRTERTKQNWPSSLNLVFNCQRATFISGLRRLTNYPAECG